MEKKRLRVARYPGFLAAVMLAFTFLLTFNCSTAFAGVYYVPGQGWRLDVWPSPTPKDPQDTSTFLMGVRFSCYDGDTGDPLNCPFNMSITEDTSFNGGHTHSRMVGTGTGIGRLSGIWVTPVSQWEVRGDTPQGINVVMWDLPEMSGKVILKTVTRPPRGYYYLPDGSIAAGTIFLHLYFNVPGLVPLPPSAAGEYTFSGLPYLADGVTPNNHTDNHYGTPRLVAAITKVARKFKIRSKGRVLGINDMSLPWGGLYDYKSTGLKPHTYHRKGESVDIDSKAVKYNQDIAQPVDPYFQDMLTYAFEKLGCTKQDEEPIHYDCQ